MFNYHNPNQPPQPIRPPPMQRSNPNQIAQPMVQSGIMGSGNSPALISRSPVQPGINRAQPNSLARPSSQDNPFSPQTGPGLYHHMIPSNQQTLTPSGQQQPLSHQSQTPMSHHSSQNPLSNAPATPATPQQQQQHSLQPGSVQLNQGPSSVQSSTYTAQDPGSVGPTSHRMTGTVPQTTSISQPFATHETDPVAVAKTLILRDLRKTIQDVNHAAERLADRNLIAPLMEKRIIAPQSVNNPQSVNPQSVNPSSVHAPNSVKSMDEKSSTTLEDSNPNDGYTIAMNSFLNVCDDIERNLNVVMEIYRQQSKFNAIQSSKTPSDVHTSSYSQLLQGYVDSMNTDKKTLHQGMEDMNRLREKIKQATTSNKSRTQNQTMKVDALNSVKQEMNY